MTARMMIALGVTIFMIVMIVRNKLPFGVPPLLACLLLVAFGVADIRTAFAGFSNPTIVMLVEFMVIIAALQKTSFLAAFKRTILNMAEKGGFKAYMLLILIVMLGCSLFGTGSTAYYVMIIGLLSTIPRAGKLSPAKVILTAGFAANHPLLPVNTALQYGIVIAVLESAGISADISAVRFAAVNLFLSLGFLLNCLLQYRLLPEHDILPADSRQGVSGAETAALPKWKEYVTYAVFVAAVIGMLSQSVTGDAGYAFAGLAAAALLIAGVMDLREIREAISSPIILMCAGVIGVSNVLGATGLTSLIGSAAAELLGAHISPFLLVLGFCVMTGLLATLTGSQTGTVYIFAPLAISTCVSLGLDPTAAACAIVLAGWCGSILPVDGMAAMIMSTGNYSIREFCKFTIPQYLIRLLALTAGALIVFPM